MKKSFIALFRKGSTNFSLSWLPNQTNCGANDKLKFVEPRAARLSLFQGIATRHEGSFDFGLTRLSALALRLRADCSTGG
jgi:hypothetical protein